jgi:hypothetical protein
MHSSFDSTPSSVHTQRRMSTAYQIIVCGSIVPDPLQTLEPVTGPNVTIPAFDNIS